MYAEPQQEPVEIDRKVIALLAVLLVLVSIAICYGGYVLLFGRQPAQPAPQLVQPVVHVSTQVVPAVPLTGARQADVFLPVVVRPAAPAALTAPIATTTSVWRFLSIDSDDIATFENVGNPSQKLSARCHDPERKVPEKGALYTLYDNGILRAQFESWNYQRFDVITGK